MIERLGIARNVPLFAPDPRTGWQSVRGPPAHRLAIELMLINCTSCFRR